MTLRLDSSKHSIHVIAVSLIAVVASSFGPWDRSTGTLILLAIATVLIGVPHGGLDHLTGRALLKSCLPRTWPFIFFPVYLGIALVVAAGWFWLPTLTATGFFIISAWHFGLEDDRTSFSHRWADHLGAIALGGLVIWIPFLTQQSRVSSILQSILPGDFLFAAEVIGPTRIIAFLLFPLAAAAILRDFYFGQNLRAIRNSCFVVLFALIDPLASFGIYFCGWHSIRGLSQLSAIHEMTPKQLAAATAPLTIGAVVLAGVGMSFWSTGQTLSETMIRTLFVSLAAIAVPHLILHGPLNDWIGNATTASNVHPSKLETT